MTTSVPRFKMAAIGTISEFDVSNPSSWDVYADQLKFYCEANSIVDETKKRATLLAVCGIKTLGIVRSLVSPASPADKSFDELVSLLKNHFTPKPSEIYSRFQFHKRVQRSDEGITAYVTELRRLADDCNFGSTLSERLRDQLVCGIRDEGLQRRLLTESDLTFESAKMKALAAETAAEQVRAMQTQVSAPAVHYINGNRRSKHDKEPTTEFRRPKDSMTTSCHGCGASHERDRCPFKEATCRHCHKKGHIERVCRKKNLRNCNSRLPYRQQRGPGRNSSSTTHEVEESTVPSSEAASIYHTNTVDTVKTSTRRKLFTKVRIEGAECEMEVDSGSDYSIISATTYERLWPRKGPRIRPLPFSLRDFQKKPIPMRGMCSVHVKYGSFEGPLRLLIAEGDRVSLLGHEWFTPLGIGLTGVHKVGADPLEQVLNDFKEVFQEGLGTYTGPTVSLPLDPTVPPKRFKARNVPLALRPKIDAALDRLLADDVIEEVTNPRWSTPVVPIIKPSGEVRLCGDYKVTINTAMRAHPYPIPAVNQLLSSLSGGGYYAKIDLAQAYLQLRVDDDSAEAQTIITHRGAFKVKRLQFGVNVAPGLFQHLMDEILVGLPGVVPYFDDILVQATTREELASRVRQVLTRLARAGLRARKDKCVFGVTSIEFLGYRVDASGIHPADSKVTAIHNAPRPRNKQELQAFLGLLNFYNSFLKDKATVAEPLHRLLDKNSKWSWTTVHDNAFKQVKKLLSSESVLVPFDEKLPTFLTCDASPYGVGAVLSQQLQDGREAPVAFSSRTLTTTERNYAQIDKEALAIIAGVKKFHHFLYGREFTIVTDHQPLLGIFSRSKQTPEIISPRMLRWSQMLNAYEFKLVHRPGKKIANADALSRLPLTVEDGEVPPPPEVLFTEELASPPLHAKDIADMTLRDPLLSRILNWVWRGWPQEKLSDEFKCFQAKRNELSVHRNCLLWGNRVVIPKEGQQRVLNELHLGHPGMVHMKAIARSYVWWPKIDEDIEQRVRECAECQATRHSPPRAPIHPWEVPHAPGLDCT